MLSVLVGTYTVFASAILAAQLVSGLVALVLSCLFQPLQRSPARGRESGPNVGAKLLNSLVSFSFGLRCVANHVLRLSIGRNRLDVGPGFFVFGERIHSFIQRFHFFIQRIHSFIQRVLACVQLRFSVGQVLVQRLNLVFGRSK